MANKTGAALIVAVRQQAGRTNDTVLITETFVLEALNEGQQEIMRELPRQKDMDSNDSTTFKLSSAKTVAIGGLVRNTNVVTGTTSAAHNFLSGQKITLSDVDSGSETNAFGGEVRLASVPTTTTFTYAQTGADESNLAAGTANAYSFSVAALDPAHIGGIWILNGGATRQQGLKYRKLDWFRRHYLPITQQGASEPTEYMRQGSDINFNIPVGSDFDGLNLLIDYTKWATDLLNGSVASELLRSNKGLILFALAECYDALALSMPQFESKALKTRVLFDRWFEKYKDYNDMLIEELYTENP